jgi:rubredoxin
MNRDVRSKQARGRRECGVCWYVYDPARGDEVWQIAPGTPFEALPEHWSCPRCAAEQTQFLALAED